TEDALAIVAHGATRWPQAALWLGGFSFGGAVAIRAAARARPAALITVAPAIGAFDPGGGDLGATSWLIVQGATDDLVEPQTVLDWARRLAVKPQIALLPDVGHFFHGRLRELHDVVVGFLRTLKATAVVANGKPG